MKFYYNFYYIAYIIVSGAIVFTGKFYYLKNNIIPWILIPLFIIYFVAGLELLFDYLKNEQRELDLNEFEKKWYKMYKGPHHKPQVLSERFLVEK